MSRSMSEKGASSALPYPPTAMRQTDDGDPSAWAFWKAFLTQPSTASEYWRRKSFGEEQVGDDWTIRFLVSRRLSRVRPRSDGILPAFSCPDSYNLIHG